MAVSSIVIKVSYRNTLRRFNATVYDEVLLEYGMEGLRRKIIGLFNLTSDSDLTLKYTDEDGDQVSLFDDDDLYEAMNQGLNPFRIFVTVNKCSTRDDLYDAMNSLPESFHEAISKMTLDDVNVLGRHLDDVADLVSKMGESDFFSGNQSEVDTVNSNESVVAPPTPAPDYVTINLENRGKPISIEYSPERLVPDARKFEKINNWYESEFEQSNEDIFKSSENIGDTSTGSANQIERFYHDDESDIVHRGVNCNGCGVYPIRGPRYNNQKNKNYDLCSTCFWKMGNDSDYSRMNRPAINHILVQRQPMSCPGLKFDSHFIADVSVKDGSMLAPSTPFSKIWKMRNSGTVVWPQGIKLVWIGGFQFSDVVSVEIKVPANGVAPEQEHDICVDFVAPEKPSRYVSYWRMVSPCGKKFGQCIWVLIQVDASLHDSFYGNSHRLNSNLPPVPEQIDNMIEKQSTYEDCLTNTNIVNENNVNKDVQTLLKKQDKDLFAQFLEFNKKMLSYNNLERYVDDLSDVSEWDFILEELTEMGFDDTAKNKELLKKNNGSMKRVVMDLIAAEEEQ